MEFTYVYRMFIRIGIRKTRNWFKYETFIYRFEFKVFRHEERERLNFLLCWLFVHRQLSTHWLNKRAAHFIDPNWSRFGEIKNRLPSSRLESQLFLFFQIPKSSALLGITSFTSVTSPVHFPIWGFYCDISDCHICLAREWKPALNVCI